MEPLDTSKMTDQEKSVLLARWCMGWKDNDNPQYPLIQTPEGNNIASLYDPANMAPAWRVLNWAYKDKELNSLGFARGLFSDWLADYADYPPADAQRLWLDKVFELCVETGIIEVSYDLRNR